MPSVPRIVVVDPYREVARIVRGALALLDRQYILIEVPSAEDALEEVLNSRIDLVVTAYQVPEKMDGLALATNICREKLGTPVIVLGEEGDPRPDASELHELPFDYFMRPVAEPFLRGLLIALDGEAAAQADPPRGESGVDLGPVPTIDTDQLRDIIEPLVRDVGAMAAILADRNGRVLIEHGALGYIDRETLAVVLGPSFARSAQVSPLLGGNAWAMHYYDGERLDVFGLSLGIHYFMCLVFEGTNRGAFGAVTMFGRRAADQMIDVIGDVAYAAKPVAPPAKSKRSSKRATREQPAIIMAEQAAPAKAAPEPAGDMAAALAAEPPAPTLEPLVDFDPDALFGQVVNESDAANLFDENTLSDLAEMLAAEDGEKVAYDDAIDMGILDE